MGQLERVKCHNCGRLIFRAYLPPPCPHHPPAAVEHKCASCNHLSLVTAGPTATVAVPDGLGGYVSRPA